MSRGKTGLIVLVGIAAMFFLFVAIIFGSTAERNAAIDRKGNLDSKFSEIAGKDLSIYWIGEVPKEYEKLIPVIKNVDPANASRQTLPVKSPEFHTVEKDAYGNVVKEEIPIKYPQYMVIVICGNPVFSEDCREALQDAVTKNGVPVIAIGDEASELLGSVISYKRLHKGAGSSLYYCLRKGHQERILPEEAVKAGGMDLAEAMPELLNKAISDFEAGKT